MDLHDFDTSVDKELEPMLAEIGLQSQALARSLRRCFRQARSSGRFDWAYRCGSECRFRELSEADLLQKLREPYENEDFETFREFVRLLRACTLHIGGNVSTQVRDLYTQTLNGRRLLLAYQLGLPAQDVLGTPDPHQTPG